ncbi:MAG: hypothetical protein ACI4SB_01590 [Acutalibacteraceae bacterium]
MKKRKTIPDGKYRVIKINRDALFEFIYESFADNLEEFLDVSDGTSVVTTFDIDRETGSFICVARNELGDDEHLQFDNVDTQLLLSKMGDTTDTMFKDGRFVELTEEELLRLQNGNAEQTKDNGLKCLEYLQNADLASLSLDDIIDVFEKMCEIPLKLSSILFETGTFDFTGEPLFYFSLVRQFSRGNHDEFMQIHADILYKPSAKTEKFTEFYSNVLWGFFEDGNIFDSIRLSEEYKAVKDEPIYRVNVNMEET